jgi:RecJ-like exonuclease
MGEEKQAEREDLIMTCEKCGGTGRPPLSASRVEICEACGGKGYIKDAPHVEDAPLTDIGGLETTKAPHEIKDARGHSDDPLDNDGGH